MEGPDLDPKEATTRLGPAARLLDEAGQAIEEGDTVRASEEPYKAAEERVKAMAEALGLSEAREAKSRGRWTLGLLDTAAEKLAGKPGRRVYDDRSHAYFLHVEGFHEARLTVDQVKARAKYVEELLEATRNVVAGSGEPT